MGDMLDWLQETIGSALKDNQFFAGGFALGLITWVGYTLRSLPNKIWRFILFQFSVSVEIRDIHVVSWFNFWLEQHKYADKCRRIKATRRAQDGSTHLVLSPGLGRHLIRESRWFLIDFGVEDSTKDSEESDGGGYFAKQYTLTMRTWGRSPKHFIELASKVKKFWDDAQEDTDKIVLKVSQGNYWRIASTDRRSLSSVVLKNDTKDELVTDLTIFLSKGRKQWYQERGIPYRRGLLLSGPPGSGKSSLAKALASHFNMDLCVLSLTGWSASDSNLLGLLAELEEEERSLVLIEDIDCLPITEARQEDTQKEPLPSSNDTKRVTLSGLLNALDGVAAPEGRVIILTSNHPEKLDSALIREGRIDKKFELSWAEKEQADELFQNFFPHRNGLAEEFASALDGKDVSMSKLQGILIRNWEIPKDAIKELRKTESEAPRIT